MATSTSRSLANAFQLLLIFLVLLCVSRTGFALRCHTCDEKQVGIEWCSQPEEVECDNSQEHICLKYVYRAGKKTWPNHIIFKCVPRNDYSRSQINACDRSTRRRPDGTVLLYETCTCVQDLCNDKNLNSLTLSENGDDNGDRNGDGDHDSPDKEAVKDDGVDTGSSSGTISRRNASILLMTTAILSIFRVA